MKIKSFASNTNYVVGQFDIDPLTFTFHFQATEQLPGWNPRNYGSSVDAKLTGNDEVNVALLGLMGCVGMLSTGNSYTGRAREYTKCAIRTDGKHFQVAASLRLNRSYGFAGDLELINSAPEASKFVATPVTSPKPVTRKASLAGTGVSYIVGQVRLGTTGDHNEEKWVHFQAKEAIPGWEVRSYGSSKDVRVGRRVVNELTGLFDHGEYEDPESLAGTGKQYMSVLIRPDGTHFQMPSTGKSNREYGFSFDEKAKS